MVPYGSVVVALVMATSAEKGDLTRLSIDELADLQVITSSRRPEPRIEAAGAVHVITEEDIRRSGISTLPDALRLSPGVQASRIDADEWALTVRGFASRLSRSVLVTLDGRSLWTPLFAGVDTNEGFEGNSPRHQVWAASHLTLPRDVDFDVVVRRVGRIPGHRIEAFSDLDLRIDHRPRRGLELALVGQNLLHRRRAEFGGGFAIDRAYRARAAIEW